MYTHGYIDIYYIPHSIRIPPILFTHYVYTTHTPCMPHLNHMPYTSHIQYTMHTLTCTCPCTSCIHSLHTCVHAFSHTEASLSTQLCVEPHFPSSSFASLSALLRHTSLAHTFCPPCNICNYVLRDNSGTQDNVHNLRADLNQKA